MAEYTHQDIDDLCNDYKKTDFRRVKKSEPKDHIDTIIEYWFKYKSIENVSTKMKISKLEVYSSLKELGIL